MSLKDKVAVVTGSTSGIGLGIARALAETGVHVVLNGLGDPAEIESTREKIETATGVRVLYNGADMSKPEAIAALMHAIWTRRAMPTGITA